MPTTIYDSAKIKLIDGTTVEIAPLKIKYLREFMQAFDFVKTAVDDDQATFFLTECARIAMQQYYPKIKTVADLEDSVDMKTVYKILDIAGGIKLENPEKNIKKQANEGGITWETLDLAKLESEVFLLGIWKDYNELESSLSMSELEATLEAKREDDYNHKKFLAAMQGVDLDKQSGKSNSNAWEEMKARVFSGGKATDPNDVVSLQGINAQKAGFGIGMGLSYEVISD